MEWQKKGSVPPDLVLLASSNGVTMEVGRLVFEEGVGYWDTGKSRLYPYNCFTHWMPLPKPPTAA